MNLLVDAGNTSIMFALESQQKILRVSEEDALSQLANIEAVIVSKVKEYDVLDNIKANFINFGKPFIVASVSKEHSGVTCGYNNIKNLGIDRWVAVIGACRLYRNRNLVIVDAGTAMTIDAIVDSQNHLGGWIVPGLSLMKQSIEQKAPLVFSSNESVIEEFGTDTPSALENGCILTLIGSIEKAVNLLKSDYNSQNIMVLLTGGDAQTLSKRLLIEHALEPDLIFHGLSEYTK
jgi:type III pantothenate kinase